MGLWKEVNEFMYVRCSQQCLAHVNSTDMLTMCLQHCAWSLHNLLWPLAHINP